MTDEKLADIFATCLQRLETGTTLDECLAAYPNERNELEGLLRVVTGLRALPRPAMLPAAARATLETRVLAQVATHRSTAAKIVQPSPVSPVISGGHSMDPGAFLARVLRALGYRGSVSSTWLRLSAVMVALVLALIVGTGVLTAARALLNTIAPTQPKSTALTSATDFSLSGAIEQLGPQSLVIRGFTIAFDAQTAISGAPVVGAPASVRGVIRDDGTLLAQDITVDGQTTEPTTPPVAANPVEPTNPPSKEPTAVPVVPTEPPTAMPEPPTAAPEPTPEPPVAATEPFARLRQILENGRAEGLAGNEGDKLIKTLEAAEAAFADGNQRRTTKYLRDLFQLLQDKARAGTIDLGFAQQAQIAVVEVATFYQLPDILGNGSGEGGGDGEGEGDNDDDDDD